MNDNYSVSHHNVLGPVIGNEPPQIVKLRQDGHSAANQEFNTAAADVNQALESYLTELQCRKVATGGPGKREVPVETGLYNIIKREI